MRSLDEWKVSGKYYLINGILHVQFSDPKDMGLHKDMFKKIQAMYPLFIEYDYLSFPRGIVITDDETDKSIISGPSHLSEMQKRNIVRVFRPSQYMWEEDEHYDLPYIITNMRRQMKDRFSQDIIDMESDYEREFFLQQIEIFTGTKDIVIIGDHNDKI